MTDQLRSLIFGITQQAAEDGARSDYPYGPSIGIYHRYILQVPLLHKHGDVLKSVRTPTKYHIRHHGRRDWTHASRALAVAIFSDNISLGDDPTENTVAVPHTDEVGSGRQELGSFDQAGMIGDRHKPLARCLHHSCGRSRRIRHSRDQTFMRVPTGEQIKLQAAYPFTARRIGEADVASEPSSSATTK